MGGNISFNFTNQYNEPECPLYTSQKFIVLLFLSLQLRIRKQLLLRGWKPLIEICTFFTLLLASKGNRFEQLFQFEERILQGRNMKILILLFLMSASYLSFKTLTSVEMFRQDLVCGGGKIRNGSKSCQSESGVRKKFWCHLRGQNKGFSPITHFQQKMRPRVPPL